MTPGRSLTGRLQREVQPTHVYSAPQLKVPLFRGIISTASAPLFIITSDIEYFDVMILVRTRVQSSKNKSLVAPQWLSPAPS
jgi:hypothetical protein